MHPKTSSIHCSILPYRCSTLALKASQKHIIFFIIQLNFCKWKVSNIRLMSPTRNLLILQKFYSLEKALCVRKPYHNLFEYFCFFHTKTFTLSLYLQKYHLKDKTWVVFIFSLSATGIFVQLSILRYCLNKGFFVFLATRFQRFPAETKKYCIAQKNAFPEVSIATSQNSNLICKRKSNYWA